MLIKVLVSILSHLLIGISLAAAQRCSDTGNFSTNSTYGKNRDLILASLPANVSANGGFLTTSVGQDPDKVYALGLCRGDSTSDQCYNCLNSSISDLIAKCPNQKEAYQWARDPCLVRYANRSLLGILELEPTDAAYNPGDIKGNLTEFDTLWETLMDSVMRKATTGSTKYGTGEADFTYFQKIYAQMQCTPDLSQNDCDFCLRETVSSYEVCCHGKQGGYVRKPSCTLRWDFYPFYASIAPAAAAPTSSPRLPPESGSPLPHQVNSTISKDSGGISYLVTIVIPIVIFVVIGLLAAVVLLNRRKKTKQNDQNDSINEKSLQFDFIAVRVATKNFSDTRILGQGGFGAVYKGKLQDGQEVAVKRLSGNSSQGQQEFKNEVLLLAKLQHRNLVRLLGFSWERKERILIYEFLPNSSLDRFIFDPVRRLQLNWGKRYKIIKGIANGLIYLHQDSQYRIIHRDLKAANILLDVEMIPKISDFGMTKLFDVDQTQSNTSTIVGTFGYIAPEYLRHGQYSVKSDVYAFGVLVLEIISGKKISSFTNEQVEGSLLTHAWKNWKEGTALEFADPILRGDSSSEIMRCIHLGLLCVQENCAYRPTMASVVLMLSSYSISLPVPSRPAFLMHSSMETETMSASSTSDHSKIETVKVSVNEVSISELDPR